MVERELLTPLGQGRMGWRLPTRRLGNVGIHIFQSKHVHGFEFKHHCQCASCAVGERSISNEMQHNLPNALQLHPSNSDVTPILPIHLQHTLWQ